jgi:hypothetical protein
MFYFGISKYRNFTRELLPEVRVQISETMRCLHPITRETSEIKVPIPLWRDFHVHGATGAPYWPILACGTHVQVKTRYFEKKFKINISTCRIQMKLST